MNRQMDLQTEYTANISVWKSYQQWKRTGVPGTRLYDDAVADLPRVEQTLSELRAQLGIDPDNDEDMIAAISSILSGKTTQDFIDVMQTDPYYSNIRFNVLANTAEYTKDGKVVRWSDADEAASRAYVEKHYGAGGCL